MRRVLLLGGSGYLGRALRPALESRGWLVDAPSSVTIDLSVADDRLCERIDAACDLVFAARTRPDTSPMAMLHGDVAMACTVARSIRRTRPGRLVVLSSIAVYGDAETNLAITEETPLGPSSAYGYSKLVTEWILSDAAAHRGCPVLTLRPSMVYGPDDPSCAYGPAAFVRRIQESGRVAVFGDAQDAREYLFIDDFVAATVQLLASDVTGVFNLAPGEARSVEEIVRVLADTWPEPFTVERVPRSRPCSAQQIVPARLLAACPGLQFTDLRAGLQRLCAASLSGIGDG